MSIAGAHLSDDDLAAVRALFEARYGATVGLWKERGITHGLWFVTAEDPITGVHETATSQCLATAIGEILQVHKASLDRTK